MKARIYVACAALLCVVVIASVAFVHFNDPDRSPKPPQRETVPSTGTSDNSGAEFHPGLDHDNDGIPSTLDVCPEVPDPSQADRDNDGLGDACDND